MPKKSSPLLASLPLLTPWPSDKDPSSDKRLKGYRSAATKQISLGEEAITVEWACYLPFVDGKPFRRTRCWFVGEVTTTRTSHAKDGLDLLSIGAQNRVDALALRVVDGKGDPISEGVSITYNTVTRKKGGTVRLTARGKALAQPGGIPAESLDPGDNSLDVWRNHGFVVIKPARNLIKGVYDRRYELTTNLAEFTLQAFFLKAEHQPGPDRDPKTQVEDGGTPPGDPSDLN